MDNINPEEIFDGLDDVKVREDLPYLTVAPETTATYDFQLEEFACGKANENQKPFVRAIGEVLASTGEGTLPPGTRATIVFAMKKWPDYWYRDVRNLVGGILGTSPNKVKITDCNKVAKEGVEGVKIKVTLTPDKKPEFPAYSFARL